MFTIVLVITIILQGWISKKSLRNGALLGFLITTGILIWGAILYSNGDAIYFSSIELSLGVFVSLCMIWYILNAGELVVSMIENNGALAKEDLNKHRKQFISICLSGMLAGVVSCVIGLSRPGSEQIPAIPLIIVGGFILVGCLLTLVIILVIPKEEDAGWPTETMPFEDSKKNQPKI